MESELTKKEISHADYIILTNDRATKNKNRFYGAYLFHKSLLQYPILGIIAMNVSL